MIVKPIELANVCAIFPSLRTGHISSRNLKKIVQDSILIDSNNPAEIIIEESLNSGLLNFKSGLFLLTKKGKIISKRHTNPGCQLSDQTKEAFIKNVFLDEGSNNWCCSQFVSELKVDTMLNTFIYDRNSNALKEDIKWLIILSDVDLIDVDKEKALINKKYLGIINEKLLSIRNPIHFKISRITEDNNQVGDFTEKLAIKYEMNRLLTGGFPSLAPLVQQISTVDLSAGFDILSFQGTGPKPDENIYIEVKGTKKDNFSFFWSNNEMNLAKEKTENYLIYGYTKVDIHNKYADGPIIVKNPILNLEGLGYTIQPLDCYVSTKSDQENMVS